MADTAFWVSLHEYLNGAGSPAASVVYGTPALVLGTVAAAGSTDEAIRRDSTIIAFDATVPVTQAFGDSAATGSAAVAARRDHKHAMPANPFTGAAAGGALDGTYPNPGLAASVAGAGLAETSDVLSVNVDGSTLEINIDTLRVKADGITANEIATGAVGASELASTAVTLGTYGNATNVGQFTVDADGRLTAASNVAITGATQQHILLADGHSTPFSFNDMLQMDDGSDFMWNDT